MENKEIKTLGDELPKEIERVNEIIREYESLPRGSGMFAAAMMKGSIKIALKAMAEGDVVAMLKSYRDLKGYEL